MLSSLIFKVHGHRKVNETSHNQAGQKAYAHQWNSPDGGISYSTLFNLAAI